MMLLKILSLTYRMDQKIDEIESIISEYRLEPIDLLRCITDENTLTAIKENIKLIGKEKRNNCTHIPQFNRFSDNLMCYVCSQEWSCNGCKELMSTEYNEKPITVHCSECNRNYKMSSNNSVACY